MSAPVSVAEIKIATKVLAKIFRSTDPFGWPFAEQIDGGRILYPTDGCLLTREQFYALAKISKKDGENYCFVAVVEGKESIEYLKEEDVFKVDLADYEDYSDLHLTLENAIFSPTGKWGGLISHEMHAILGASTDFITKFNEIDQFGNEQWSNFQAEWPAQRHRLWLDSIARHI